MPATYVGPVRRIRSGKGHRYVDANGAKVPGVTTMIKAIKSEALERWMVRATAEYAIDHWAELNEMKPSERLNRLIGARYETSDAASNRGRDIHDAAVRLVRGEEVDIEDAIAGHVASLIAFFDAFHVRPVLTEFIVFSHTHGYAGTGDAILDLPFGLPEPHPFVSKVLAPPALRLLADYKSKRAVRPKIYGETCLQCAGYRYADTYLDEYGVEQPMMPVDGCIGVSLSEEDYDVYPLEADENAHRVLLYAAQIKGFSDYSADYVGDPIRHPSRVQRRRLEVVQGIEVAS